jgi:hypothetical protein
MITLFSKTYAKNKSEFIRSLFSKQTCNGFYKQSKKGINLYNIQRNVIAFIKAPANGENAFIVSAYKSENGKTRYMQGLSTLTELYLGVPESYKTRTEKLTELFITIYQLKTGEQNVKTYIDTETN